MNSVNKINNPFYIKLNENLKEKFNYKELYKNYEKVYIICKKNNKKLDYEIFEKEITKEKLEKNLKKLEIIETTKEILSNYQHRKSMLIIKREILEKINKEKEYEEDEIIIYMPNIKKEDVEVYKKIYEEENKIEKIQKIIVLKKYFKSDEKKTINKIKEIIKTIKSNNYWGEKENCEIYMGKIFEKRNFKLKYEGYKKEEERENKEEIKEKIRRIFEASNNYANDEEERKNKIHYVDPSLALKNDKIKKYIINKEEISRKMIIDIFKNIEEEKIKYELFNKLLVSKDYCHLVINEKILEIMNPIIEENKELYRYLIGYTWLTLYIEECIMKTRTSINDRYVIDINTANKLPKFKIEMEDIKKNPYVIFMGDDKNIYSKRSSMSTEYIEEYKYGIVKLEEFKLRMNKFISNDKDIDIFEGLEKNETGRWQNFTISGSIIPACTMNNPLLKLMKTEKEMKIEEEDKIEEDEEKFEKYYDEYYKNSDIDVICRKTNIYEYLNETNKLINVIKKNISILKNEEEKEEDIEISDIKGASILITKEYLKKYNIKEEEIKEGENLKNTKNEELKKIIYEDYIKLKEKNNEIIKKKYKKQAKNNILYNLHWKKAEINELNIFLTESISELYNNEIIIKENEKIIMKIIEGSRFKVSSPYLKRDIEIFKTKYEEPFSMVSKFHLPCVRGYYNGENVYLLPSCITALMTLINIDYKYFAGSNDPVTILNKYRRRGFSIILNKRELYYMTEYNKTMDNEKFNNIKYKNKIFIDINHEIYKSKEDNEYNYIKRNENENNENINNNNNENENKKENEKNAIKEILKNMKTINKEGHINTLKYWISEAYNKYD